MKLRSLSLRHIHREFNKKLKKEQKRILKDCSNRPMFVLVSSILSNLNLHKAILVHSLTRKVNKQCLLHLVVQFI